MRFTYSNTLFILIVAHILLPVFIILWLWFGKNRSKLIWLIKIIITLPCITLLYLSGYWQQLSYYGRFLLIVLYFAAAAKSFFTVIKLPFHVRLVYVDWILTYSGLIIAIILSVNIVNVFRGSAYSKDAVELAFPFSKGVYMISFGGNGEISPLINYHYKIPLYSRTRLDPSVKFAVDIVELNEFGRSADGLLPLDNSSYRIFDTNVYSPCDGIVVNIEDKWPNERPFAYNYPYNPGNSIVIKYNDVFVLLGHLNKGSFCVKAGDTVKKGQLIARAGNSGWTTEPHLHLQVMKTYNGADNEGEGLPFLFDGTFPVKNTLFVR